MLCLVLLYLFRCRLGYENKRRLRGKIVYRARIIVQILLYQLGGGLAAEAATAMFTPEAGRAVAAGQARPVGASGVPGAAAVEVLAAFAVHQGAAKVAVARWTY